MMLKSALVSGVFAMTAPVVYGVVPANVGADVPFITLEAESPDVRTNGQVIRLKALPGVSHQSPELEASGRAHVELRNVGDFVEFTSPSAFNTMVIRHCIPDAPEGGGIEATLGLYVNGQRRQSITLSSRHNWLYGTGKVGENGQSDTPTPFPHVFWDEADLFIEGGVQPGDIIRLQKDEQDTAEFYRIDLVDLEMVGPPLPQPENSLAVADYGATGKDAATDTAAMKRCIADAKAQGKIVYIPPGKYLQNEVLDLDGVKVQGAGMWYTTLYDTVGNDSTTWAGYAGFRFHGDGTSVSDLRLDSLANTRRPMSSRGITGFADNFEIRNVWFSRLGVGIWLGGENGIVSHCRVRHTYADGLNINNGKTGYARNVVLEHNHVRGAGDDGIAIFSSENSPNPTNEIIVRRNTVVANWWGGNISLGGGERHRVEDNLITDGIQTGFRINLPNAYPKRPVADCVIRGNVLLRCGSNYASQKRGAIWVHAGYTTIRNTIIADNLIVQPVFRGIHIVGPQSQELTVKGNRIESPGEDAIAIGGEANGKVQFFDNTVIDLPAGHAALVGGGEAITLEQSGNNWQQ